MEINNQILESTGLSIVHSLWQGALLLFIVLSALVIARNKSARFRYLITLTGTFLLPVILVGNLIYFWPHQLVDNSMVASATGTEMIADIPTQFSIPNNGQQQNNTVLWLNENASTIAIFWIVGMSLFLLKVLGSFVWLKRLTKQALPMHNTAVNELLTTIQEKLAIQRTVELKLSSWIKSPIILGVIKPTILFPIGLIEGLTIEEVEAILYHELAHLKRNDFIVNIMINVLQIVFFYHPAYWWMKSQLDNEREFATDEMALHYSEKKLPMIKALAKVQAYSLHQHSLAFAGNSKNQVLKRINLIMKAKQQPNWLSAVFTMVILMVAFALMSVKEQKTENGKIEKQEEAQVNLDASKSLNSGETDTVKLKSAGLIRSFTENHPSSEIDADSIHLYKDMTMVFQSKKFQDNDSLAISKAILELVTNPEGYEVKFNDEGTISSISKNNKPLAGSEFETFKSAYNQIQGVTQQLDKELVRTLDEMKKSKSEVELQKRNVVKSYWDPVKGQQLSKIEAEYQATSLKLKEILQVGNVLDQTEVQQIEEHERKLKALEKELLELQQVAIYNDQIERELQKREALEDAKYLEELNRKSDNRMVLPGGEANEGILNVLLQPFSKKKSSTLYILDGKVLTDSDELENQIELLRSIEIVSGSESGLKDFFGEETEGKSTIIRFSTALDDERIRLRRQEQNRSKEVENLKKDTQAKGRPAIELNNKLLENATLNDINTENIMFLEVFSGSTMYKFYSKEELKGHESLIRIYTKENEKNPSSLFHAISTSLNSSKYFFNSNTLRVENFDFYILEKFKGNNNVLIEFEGVVKEGWTVEKLRQEKLYDINSIEVLKGNEMEKHYPKRKLREVSALLRVNPKN